MGRVTLAQSGRMVWIARHGHRMDMADESWALTAANPYDPPLSPLGVAQAADLSARLAGERIAHIVTSPFERAVATAAPLAAALGVSIKIEPGIAEWMNPQWFRRRPMWRPPSALAALHGVVDVGYISPIDVAFPATWDDLLLRTQTAVRLILETFDGSVLFVGHGASVMGIASALSPGAQVSGELCCLIRFAKHGGTWVLEDSGSTSHWVRGGG